MSYINWTAESILILLCLGLCDIYGLNMGPCLGMNFSVRSWFASQPFLEVIFRENPPIICDISSKFAKIRKIPEVQDKMHQHKSKWIINWID